MTVWTPVVRVEDRSDPLLFAIPQFEVLIEGMGLPKDVVRDVSEITYRDSLTEFEQFEITVNNWDSEHYRFKYIGSETAEDLKSDDAAKKLFRLFEPSKKSVKLMMGYGGSLRQLMVGTITTMETSFASSGAATLTVRVLDLFHNLRKTKYSTAWENKTPSQIAKNISALNDKGKKRFPVPLRIIPGTETHEQPIPFVAQTSQHDIDFLLNLARQHGYEITSVGEDEKQEITFGRASEAKLPVNYALDWGRTLVDFKPTLTTAGRFKSVTVRGWDRKLQKVIKEKVKFNDPELKDLNAKILELVKLTDPAEEQSVDLPVVSKSDARRRAIGLMRDNIAGIIKASGTTIGLPELRAGTRLRIGNIGSRLSGDYLVTKTTHSIGEGGYTTKFECRLENFEGKRP